MIENQSGYYPLEDRVVLEVILMEEKTSAGIVIAQTTKDNENMASIHGFIRAAGEEAEKRMAKNNVKVGDMVMHAKYAGLPFKGKDGGQYRMMNVGDVVALAEGAYGDTFKARIPIKPGA